MSRPTMRDVADLAGVGLQTVSRVVNDEPGVAAATDARVREAIASLGYQRNHAAGTLRRGRTGTVGLLVEYVADPFYAALTREVERQVRAHDCALVMGSSAEAAEGERRLVEALIARRIDGLLLVPTRGASQAALGLAGTAVVCLDRPPVGLRADVVLSDNRGGVRSAVRHLVARGHRRIAFLGDVPEVFTATERLAGFQAAMASAGLPADDVSMGAPSPQRLRPVVADLLAAGVTAVVAGNNRTTVALLEVLRSVDGAPEVVGFDDFELAALHRPALTTVAQDPAALAQAAVDLLFARLEGDTGRRRRVVVPTRLVLRG